MEKGWGEGVVRDVEEGVVRMWERAWSECGRGRGQNVGEDVVRDVGEGVVTCGLVGVMCRQILHIHIHTTAYT